jgi:hypothetical protein
VKHITIILHRKRVHRDMDRYQVTNNIKTITERQTDNNRFRNHEVKVVADDWAGTIYLNICIYADS